MEILESNILSDKIRGQKSVLPSANKNSFAGLSSAFQGLLKNTEFTKSKNLTSLNDGSKMKEIIDASNLPRNDDRISKQESQESDRYSDTKDRSFRRADGRDMRGTVGRNNFEDNTGNPINNAIDYGNTDGHEISLQHDVASLNRVRDNRESEGGSHKYADQISADNNDASGTEVRPAQVSNENFSVFAGVSNGHGGDSSVSQVQEGALISALYSAQPLNSKDFGLRNKSIHNLGISEGVAKNNSGEVIKSKLGLFSFNEQSSDKALDPSRFRNSSNFGKSMGQNNNSQNSKVTSAQLYVSNLSHTAKSEQQVQELAKVTNGGSLGKIKVDLVDQATSLNSKPVSNLSYAAIQGSFLALNRLNSQQQNLNGQNLGLISNNSVGLNNVENAQFQNVQQQIMAQNQLTGSSGQINSAVKASANAQISQNVGSQNASSGDPLNGLSSQVDQSDKVRQTQSFNQGQRASVNTRTQALGTNGSVTDQISIKILKAIQAGNDQIKIQLKPAELGRVEVKMELANDGRVLAVITADNKDTLELLRRDAPELQRALNDTGMKLNSGDLSFNLKENDGREAKENESAGKNKYTDDDPEIAEDALLSESNLFDTNGLNPQGRIDIRA